MRPCPWFVVPAVAVVAFAAAAAAAAAAPPTEDLDAIRAAFSAPEPPRTMGPLFWLHGGETPELIREMVGIMHAGGMGEFTIESRPHRDYLGPEWWEACRTAIVEAERLGMKVWIFDEKWFPSGVAGGKVLEASPRHRRHFIVEAAQVVEGPGERAIALPAGEEIVAVVAMPEGPEGSLSDLRLIPGPWAPATEIRWQAPEGRWRVCAYPLRSAGNYLDYLNPDAVACFIRLTHEATYEKLGRWFGTTVRGFFMDEPGFHNGGGQWPWTFGFAERFAKRKGYDPRPLLAALARDLGPDGAAFRHDYHEALVDEYAQTFYKPIHDWCRAHGVLSIGHFYEHDSLHYSLGAGVGDYFRVSRYLDWGGIDVVFKQAWPGKESLDHWGMPKLASSAAHVFDLADDMAFDETFGAYGWDLGLKGMKWLADWQCVRGINYLCPHAFDPKWPDEDCPPFYYARGHNVQWPYFRKWADFANRVSFLLRKGRHIAPVAVLYPAPSRWAGPHEPVERVAQALLCGQWDFDIVPYESFVRDARIDGASLALAKESYRAVVLPGVEAIPIAVLEKLAAFRAAGGRVLATARIPERACERGRHDEASALAARIWPADSPALVARTQELPTALRAAGLEPDLDVSPPSRDIRYLHRERAGAQFYYVTNESPRADVAVDVIVPAPAGRTPPPP
ncbi:MAG: hypothetical protein JXP34_25415, partial [Planctomycetes bacterium]|nr:hypothetical protein [Planctomycetota bacterium]